MFQVFEDGYPAVLPNSKYKCWHNSKFNTFEEAKQYANDWLGMYGPHDFVLGVPYMLYGVPILIVEVSE